MSSIYDSCFQVLKTVLHDKIMFAVSLKKHSHSIKKDEFQSVSSLCGLFLRNYYFITTLSEAILKTNQEEPKIYLGLAYVNNDIKHIVDKNETYAYLTKKLALYQIKFTDEVKQKMEISCKDKKTFLKETFGFSGKKSGFKFLASRNNLPEWVVTTLLKQYDKEIAIRSINAMTRMPRQFVSLNKVLLPVPPVEFERDYKLVDENAYEFQSTSSVRKNQFVRTGEALPIQLAEVDFAKHLPDLKDSFITLFFEDKNGFYPLLLNKYLKNNKVSIIAQSQRNNPELFNKIKNERKEGLDIYESTESGICAHLSEKQNLLIFMPKSSNLELLRRTPEYGILFDTNQLDSIISNELEELCDITQYVEEGGYLAYCVPTFNIKETMIITKEFLEKHKEFQLENDKIYFPYEKENSVFYYALFKRK